MVISNVFNEFPEIERLEGYVDVENKASKMVLEKAGFLKEGMLRKYFAVKVCYQDELALENAEELKTLRKG
ncbi:unnamed protein product [Dovyalis caffra]|uniref:N-acetyltransferase domain-containing protein n=1 Tax=Dovyalis caffra TaxID=77055 RepID=A0AAV1R193_9ROSI|nr:unnamed protein product [Dovyalis caffra]